MTLQDELEGKTQWTKVSQQELDSILERHALFVDGQHNGRGCNWACTTCPTWTWRAGTCRGRS